MVTMRAIAGIGSTKTPPEAGTLLTEIIRAHVDAGFILYSGGAAGADAYCESGAGDAKRIFYGNARHKQGDRYESIPARDARHILVTDGRVADKAAEIMASTLDAAHWQNIVAKGPFVQNLFRRNTFQVLGPDLRHPVELVVCWAPPDRDGSVRGGTKGAVRLARRLSIPVYNIAAVGELNDLRNYMRAGFPLRAPEEFAIRKAAIERLGISMELAMEFGVGEPTL
jgi:hypothetical protein